MLSPNKSELPPPPPGKTGWPWTEQTEPLLEKNLDKLAYPKITIVTPNYNYGNFLEETIRSVLLQGYPNLEYIIIDGGSTDNSVEIIKKYSKWLSYWVSESDCGQSNAINKGFKLCSGDVVSWLNSDDRFYKGALFHIANFFTSNVSNNFVSGQSDWIDGNNKFITNHILLATNNSDLLNYHKGYYLSQPATFYKKSLLDKVGLLDEKLHYTMDLDLWLRVGFYNGIGYSISTIPEKIAMMVSHEQQKTSHANVKAMREVDIVVRKYAKLYGLTFIQRFGLHIELLKFRAYRVWSDLAPEIQKTSIGNFWKLSNLWLKNVPLYLVTPSYFKFVIKSFIGL